MTTAEPLTQRRSVSPSMSEVIVEAINARLAELHVGLPAKIVDFDPDKQTCDVQPLLLRLIYNEDEEIEEERFPQITNVPIHYPSGGGWSLIFPLNVDDIVFLTFAERSIDQWLEGEAGQEINPQHSRKHDLSDAVCVPGIRTRNGAIAELGSLGEDCRLGRDDGDPQILLKANGDVEIGAKSGDAAIIIRANGDIEMARGATEAMVLGNTLNANLLALTVPTAFGPSGPPINAGAFSQHLSTKQKVK